MNLRATDDLDRSREKMAKVSDLVSNLFCEDGIC
jgi:hypothetical protein